jgi:heme exporter protein CcmD
VNWDAAHAGFVLSAYVISAVAIVGLIAWVLWRDGKARSELRRQDKTGHER